MDRLICLGVGLLCSAVSAAIGASVFLGADLMDNELAFIVQTLAVGVVLGSVSAVIVCLVLIHNTLYEMDKADSEAAALKPIEVEED